MPAKMFNRVKSLRIRGGLTQADLARKIQVSEDTVGAIETGRQDATLLTAVRIGRVFQVPVENIFREQPFPQLIGSGEGESQSA